ncbi:MAG: hypothetical protein SCALA702_29700 [Melioribacteraceae bacterium]|nr:MAG: hypothetical protein SCALA702_29700 [Melioribacteraceae bacterium]
MKLSKPKIWLSKDFFMLVLMLMVSVIAQIYISEKFSSKSLILLTVINGGLAGFLWFLFYIKRIDIFLVWIYLFPYVIITNSFNYVLRNEVITSLPIYLLLLITLLDFLRKTNLDILPKTRFTKILFFFLLYSFAGSAWGYLNGFGPGDILIETMRIFYYAFVFVFLYLFNSREEYYRVFKALLVVSLLIALGHIALFLKSGGLRFVAFQMNFLPFAAGILLAFSLTQKKLLLKLFSFSLFGIVSLGSIVTLTRSLWVTLFAVLGVVFFFYLKDTLKLKKWKLGLLIFVSVIVLGVAVTKIKPQKLSAETNDKVDYRVSSIFNPSSDLSFLMRIELNYYAILEFIDSPLIGQGNGAWVKYKILPGNPFNQYYLDNSWLQFFWKGGLIGGILFLYLFYISAKNAYRIYRLSNNYKARMICLGLLGAIIGISLLSLLQPMLIKYKANVIIAFLMAYIEYENRMLDKQLEGELNA